MTRAVTLAGFVAIVAAGLALELHARRRGRATLADTVALALRHPVPRLATAAFWLWLGWHLFARVDW